MSTAPELSAQLMLFRRLTSKKAMAPAYRALVLAPGHVRAMGLFGQMQTEINLGLDTEVLVDAEDFLQTLRSLPKAEFEVKLENGALRWVCGPAKGHFAPMGADIAVPVPAPLRAPESAVGASFAEGLELGALACGKDAALRTHNLMGVQIRSRDGRTVACASDNICVSICDLEAVLEPEGTITLLPDAISLLGLLIDRDGDALLSYDDGSLYCATASTRLLLHQVPPLRTDLSAIAGQFTESAMPVPLFHDAVQAFLRRSEALAEERAIVEVSVEDGRLSLAYRATGSSTEEYILTNGPKVTVPPIRIEAYRLARALAHADRLVFDYTNRNVLILRGGRGFLFAITGRITRPEGGE